MTAFGPGWADAAELGEHLRLALEAGGLGTWRWDLRSGRTIWDARLEELHGLEPGSFDGTFESYVARLHPDDRDDVLRTVADAVATVSRYQVEHRIVLPDGGVRWVGGVGGVTLDDDGEVTGTIGCVGDITERKIAQIEEARQASEVAATAVVERVQRERLEFLSAINDALNAATTTAEIMANVTAAAVPRLGDWCVILVLPASGGTMPDLAIAHVDPNMVALARRLLDRFPYDPDAPTGVPQVIRTGISDFVPDISDELLIEAGATEEERQFIERLALRSAMSVPLMKRGRVLGAMQFVMSGSSRRYTVEDLALAEAVGARIASSLENRRLLEQQHRIAQTLQRSLLPTHLPEISGLSVAVRYWAAGEGSEVGGDFYDLFEIGPDRWGLVIGDVCGTGPIAAATTGLARHTIRDSAWHGDAPAEVLASLHRAVSAAGIGSFCTAAYGALERGVGGFELELACGGHPLPIHVSDGVGRPVGRYGTLLGLMAETISHPVRVSLGSGDTLVLFTDGATDVRAPYGLTDAEFVRLVTEATSPSAEATADEIHRQLDARLSFGRRNDDLALLVLRVR